jgi:hypothetical protein
MIFSAVISSEGYDTLRQQAARDSRCGFAATIRLPEPRRLRLKIKAESRNDEATAVSETWPSTTTGQE